MRRIAICLTFLLASGVSAASDAAIFKRELKAQAVLSSEMVSDIQRAIDEQRLLDAGRYLNQAFLAGVKDPRLNLLDGNLNLAQGHFQAALDAFAAAEKAPETRPETRDAALEGKGIALSLTGNIDEALPVLQAAVAANPSAWRAWNALGSAYDDRGQWTEANAAYEQAVPASGGAAIVLNNRGYSRLLQHQRDLAVTDFVAALRRKPDFAEARTNLRLALAMGGDYDRAIAGGTASEQAALLNNAGFAAAMHGDYANAEQLLNRALALKSEYYAVASDNLKIVQALSARSEGGSKAAR